MDTETSGMSGIRLVRQPAAANRLGEYLAANFSQPWEQFCAAVAFVRRTGTCRISAQLAQFSRTAQVEIIAGIDHGGTSSEGLQDLLDAVSPTGRIIIFHNRQPYTFHPKIYLFKSFDKADLVVGSGNLTEGGLYTNYEAGLRLSLDLTDTDQKGVLHTVEQMLDSWSDLKGCAKILDDDLLRELKERKLVLPEAAIAGKQIDGHKSAARAARTLFKSRPEHPAPQKPGPARKSGTATDAKYKYIFRVGSAKPQRIRHCNELMLHLIKAVIGSGDDESKLKGIRQVEEICKKTPLDSKPKVFWEHGGILGSKGAVDKLREEYSKVSFFIDGEQLLIIGNKTYAISSNWRCDDAEKVAEQLKKTFPDLQIIWSRI